MSIKEILTVGSDGQATAGGSGLNEQPLKNYMKTYANANSALTIAGTIITATGNLVSLTSAHVSNLGTTITSSASTILRGTNNYLTSMADTDTSGAAFFQLPAFTLEGSDYGKPVSISFDVNGVTADGNWDVVIARYTSAGVYGSLISVAGNASGATPASAKLPTGTATFNGFFVPDSTTPTDLYAIRLRHRVSNAAIRVDTLFIGPQPVRVGSVNTGSVSWTPTLTGFGSPTGVSFSYVRNGEFLEAIGFFTSGVTTGVTAAISLPTGLTSNMGTTAGDHFAVGRWDRDTSTASQVRNGLLVVPNTASATVVNFTYSDYNAAASPFTLQLANNIINSQKVEVSFKVKINEWSSNVTMADRAVEYYLFNTGATTTAGADNSASTTGYGIAGTPIIAIASTTGGNSNTTFTMTPQQPVQSTDLVTLEFSSGTGWIPVTASGAYGTIQGGSSYGAGAYVLSDGSVRATFGNKGAYPLGVGYSDNGQAWSGLTSTRWRVRVVKGGAQVGYPISSANIVGRTDGNAPATGMVGEVLTQTWTGVTVTTGGTTLATHSSVGVGNYLAIIEADAIKATATRQVSAFGGTATTTVVKSALGGDFVNTLDTTAVALYVTYYFRVTVAGSVTLTSTTTTASTTSNRGSFSLVRIA